jgi:hypothetical protein
MSSSSLLDQAKQGDAAAIEALMNQALQPKGIEVRCDRQGDCLQLWLIGAMLPPQTSTVSYVRRGMERLQVQPFSTLHIYALMADQPDQGWGVEVSLRSPETPVRSLTAAADDPLEPEAASLGTPAASDTLASPNPLDTSASPEASEFSEVSDTPASPASSDISESSPAPAVPELPEPAADLDSTPATLSSLEEAYALLDLELGATVKQVEGSYFKLKALALREGDRAKVEDLKRAFYQLKDYIEHPPVEAKPQQAQPQDPNTQGQDGLPDEQADDRTPVERIEALLKQGRLSAQVKIHRTELQVAWLAVRVVNPEDTAKQVHTFLLSQDLAALGLEGIDTLVISSLNRDQSVVWQKTLSLRPKGKR